MPPPTDPPQAPPSAGTDGGTPVVEDAAGASDVGRVRQRNEDAWLVAAPLYAVADGLGGHPAGDVASLTALSALAGTFDEASGADAPRQLVDAAHAANRAVRDAARDDPARTGMGTTLTAATVVEGRLHLAHVGDSRCYLLRGADLRQVSVDHTPVQEQVDAGRLAAAAADHHPMRHVLARALGLEEDVEVDTRGTTPLAAGDVVLLCTDGLTEMLDTARIAELLGAPTAQGAADDLVAAAVAAGGVDNVTTVVLRIGF